MKHKDLFEAMLKWEENWRLFLELEVPSGQEPLCWAWCWVTGQRTPCSRSVVGRTRAGMDATSGVLVGFVTGALQGQDPAVSVSRGCVRLWAGLVCLVPPDPSCTRGKELTPVALPAAGETC